MARRFRSTAMVLAAAGLIALVTPGVAGAGGACRPLDAPTRAAIDEIAAVNVGGPNLPGLSLVITSPKGCYRRSYGVGDVASGAPMRAADHVRIASITKTFTATLILQMVDKHMLSLDDTLSRYVPGVPNGDRITLRQVLGMSAGIYDYTSDERFTQDLDANPLLRFTTADFFAILHRHPPAYEPGTQVVYSDSNYYLLSLVAQMVGRRPLGELITRWILDPLHLSGTSYPTGFQMPSPYAHGYLPGDPIKEVRGPRPELSVGAGAMISTIGDLDTWARALARGTLLSRTTQAERLRIKPLTGVKSPLTIGYGLGLFEIQGYLGHNGAILGYSSVTFYRPDIDTTISVAGNRSSNFTTPTTTVFVAIATQLNPDLFPKG